MDRMKLICWAMQAGETKIREIAEATGIGRDTVASYMSWARKAGLDPELARSIMNADSVRRKRANSPSRNGWLLAA